MVLKNHTFEGPKGTYEGPKGTFEHLQNSLMDIVGSKGTYEQIFGNFERPLGPSGRQ